MHSRCSTPGYTSAIAPSMPLPASVLMTKPVWTKV
uniref:Uncharacterized protein n=1 Tax=Arundo donax TaxID=35708 RepID=A0A0A9CA06_ARUDO